MRPRTAVAVGMGNIASAIFITDQSYMRSDWAMMPRMSSAPDPKAYAPSSASSLCQVFVLEKQRWGLGIPCGSNKI